MMEQNELRKTQNSDADLLAMQWLTDFQAGSKTAFSKLYDVYVNMLFNYGCRLTTDKELLKDCIQDVFIKIYSKRSELGSIAHLKSYLIISLKNKLCDESRKRTNLSDLAVEELDAPATDNIESEYIASEKEHLESNLLKRLMGQLSPRQREALTLYYIEEKKYEDICEIMEMNYQSVRNLMHRGMLKLRTLAN